MLCKKGKEECAFPEFHLKFAVACGSSHMLEGSDWEQRLFTLELLMIFTCVRAYLSPGDPRALSGPALCGECSIITASELFALKMRVSAASWYAAF